MDEAEAEDATEGAMSRNPRTKGASGTALPAKQDDAAGTSQHSHLEKKKQEKRGRKREWRRVSSSNTRGAEDCDNRCGRTREPRRGRPEGLNTWTATPTRPGNGNETRYHKRPRLKTSEVAGCCGTGRNLRYSVLCPKRCIPVDDRSRRDSL